MGYREWIREAAMNNRGGIFVVLFASLVLIAFIGYSLVKVFESRSGDFASLAILILVGLGAFIGLMNFLSFSAQWIGLADPHQPFGLPEGTVRAILTIAFIVLVGVLASFLLTNSAGRQPFVKEAVILRAIPSADAQALQQRLSAEGLVMVVAVPPAGSDVYFYARQDYRLADDVSKQVLTILSTILAAMIGFYFGARPGDGGGQTGDPAERARILTELNTFAAQPPTVQSIRTAANAKLATVDAQKKPQVEKILKELNDVQGKVDAAQRSVGDLSLPIDKVRAARDEAKAAVGKLEGLNQDLQKI
jgi:hypothetical protein